MQEKPQPSHTGFFFFFFLSGIRLWMTAFKACKLGVRGTRCIFYELHFISDSQIVRVCSLDPTTYPVAWSHEHCGVTDLSSLHDWKWKRCVDFLQVGHKERSESTPLELDIRSGSKETVLLCVGPGDRVWAGLKGHDDLRITSQCAYCSLDHRWYKKQSDLLKSSISLVQTGSECQQGFVRR